MSKKKICIGPYQLGNLAALHDVVNLSPFFDHLGPVDSDGIFYACMLQSGADEFAVPEMKQSRQLSSSFLRQRMKIYASQERAAISAVVQEALGVPLASPYTVAHNSLRHVAHFVEDVLFAAKRQESPVSVVRIPTEAEICAARTVSPKFATATDILLAEIKRQSVAAPVPKSVLDRIAVDRLQELLSSDLFRRYSSAHNNLDDGSYPQRKAIELVARTGRDLRRGFRDHLALADVGVALLALSTKLVDLALGKLPGLLADFAVRIAEPILKERRQIVIYEFGAMFERVISSRMRQLAESTRHGHDSLEANGSDGAGADGSPPWNLALTAESVDGGRHAGYPWSGRPKPRR